MIPVRILGTGAWVEGEPVTTREIALRAAPGRDPDEIERRIGIATRRWVGPSVSAASLGARALKAALARASLRPEDLARVVFVNSTGGDHLVPANANEVLSQLGLSDTCDGFDLNNACAGFLSAFDVAARSVATGLGPVAVVAAETFSPFLPPDKPRPYMVMGDAAAAVILGPARPGEGVLATSLRNSAAVRGGMIMPHPGRSGERAHIDFRASYAELGESALAAITGSSARVLAAAGIGIGDVAWFLPHQPNGRLFDQIVEAMGVPPERTVPVASEIGSVGAASIPVSLDRLFRTREVRPGDHVLMATVGAGTAYGATLLRVGGEAS